MLCVSSSASIPGCNECSVSVLAHPFQGATNALCHLWCIHSRVQRMLCVSSSASIPGCNKCSVSVLAHPFLDATNALCQLCCIHSRVQRMRVSSGASITGCNECVSALVHPFQGAMIARQLWCIDEILVPAVKKCRPTDVLSSNDCLVFFCSILYLLMYPMKYPKYTAVFNFFF